MGYYIKLGKVFININKSRDGTQNNGWTTIVDYALNNVYNNNITLLLKDIVPVNNLLKYVYLRAIFKASSVSTSGRQTIAGYNFGVQFLSEWIFDMGQLSESQSTTSCSNVFVVSSTYRHITNGPAYNNNYTPSISYISCSNQSSVDLLNNMNSIKAIDALGGKVTTIVNDGHYIIQGKELISDL